LRYFDLIVPCGIAGKRVTSVERALGRAVSMNVARERLIEHFASIFDRESRKISGIELEQILRGAPAIAGHAGSVAEEMNCLKEISDQCPIA
jgi:hypothetical protein